MSLPRARRPPARVFWSRPFGIEFLSLVLVQKKERSRFVQTKTRARRSESTKDDSGDKEKERELKEYALRVAFASQNFNHADVVYE